MNTSEAFARHVLETPYSALPAAAISAAKTFILDTVGVGVAGARAPFAAETLSAARRWGGASVTRSASVFGGGARLPAPSAAFVNGFQIHCQEYDCVHEGAVVHPMATIFAAVMAEIESRPGATGADLIAAIILAVDVAAGLGIAALSALRFFRPANAGLFGATLAVARLRGFRHEQALDAIGYALAHCSGTMQAHVEGKPALPIQIGNAARAALLSCDLAEAGLPGPHDVMDGPFGYLALFETQHDVIPVRETLGRVWRITEVSHKPFPTGRAAQGGIVAMQRLRAEGARPELIESVALTGPPLIKRLVGRSYQDGMKVNYARLCFPYCGAVALMTGAVALDDFSEEKLADPEIAELARRISVEDDGSTDPAAFTPQRARARLKDGRILSVEIKALLGSPAEPLPRDAQRAKFHACLSFGLGAGAHCAAGAIVAFVDDLERQPDAHALSRLAAGATS
jgi:2-methylcitrate dehydratase PrpD